MNSNEIEKLEENGEKGDVLALFNLAEIYFYGDGVKCNKTKAFEYYKKAAEAGYARAQYIVGKYFEDGKCVDKDLETANKWFEKAANQDNADVLYHLAFNRGLDCDRDVTKAFELYSRAANLGHAKSQYELAQMYRFGLGCEEDGNTAVKWFTESANQGNLFAQKVLGDIYYYGSQNIEENSEKAFECYKKYVEQGGENDSVKTILADMYYDGHGCEKNFEEAFKLFKQATNSDGYAQYSLGWMYEHGQGTKIDFKEALDCYLIAAEKNEKSALYRLALIYHYSDPDFGVLRPVRLRAKVYYERAIANGYIDKDKNLEKLKKEMEQYFVIEGIVSDYSINKTFDFEKSEDDEATLQTDKTSLSFSITGTEGYSVKKENKKINIFFLQSTGDKKIEESYNVRTDIKFTVSKEFSEILIHAVNHNKKIRLVISKTDLKYLSDNNNTSNELKDITISLLQD